jgi:shikimate kinase
MQLGREFWDTDIIIEEQTGLSIVRIFSERSEKFFRHLERELVGRIKKSRNLVVAVGGGMTIPDRNYADLSENGLIVCLYASVDTLTERLREAGTRPLLMGNDLRTRVAEILERRDSSYDRIPLRITTDDLSVEETAAEVIRMYQEQIHDV